MVLPHSVLAGCVFLFFFWVGNWCVGGLVSTCGLLGLVVLLFWGAFRCLLFCLLCLYVWLFNSVVIALIFLLIGLVFICFGVCELVF